MNFSIPADVIANIRAEIKKDVAREVETVILRQNVAVALSRLKDLDTDRTTAYQQAQTTLGLS
jgi:hypothetical protein